MATGMFLGVTPSFTPESASSAKEFGYAINVALTEAGQTPYYDPESLPNPYVGDKFGRSSLDHCASDDLAALAGYCTTSCPQLEALASNPYRITFLPGRFSMPIETAYAEKFDGEEGRIRIDSLPVLAEELQLVANELRIPLSNGSLANAIAQQIDDYQELMADDPCDSSERITWLMVFEGCRLAIEYQTALSFAG